MVHITPKEPGIVQAQVAQFASEHVELPRDRAHILQNLSDIAALKGVEDTTDPVTYKAYLDFMKDHARGVRSDTQNGRSEIFSNRDAIMQAYTEFAPAIHAAIENLDEYQAGWNSIVFPLNHNDKEYMVRRPFLRSNNASASTIDHHIAAAALTRHIPHFENVVAASYQDGLTVAEKMPGNTFHKLTIQDIEAITDTQLKELIITMQEANRLGLEIDFNPSNFLYDKHAGFGLIDLAVEETDSKRLRRLADLVTSAIGALHDGIRDLTESRVNDTDNALKTATNRVIERYKSIVFEVLDKQTAQEATGAIRSLRVRKERAH